jgi:hypothetical protein
MAGWSAVQGQRGCQQPSRRSASRFGPPDRKRGRKGRVIRDYRLRRPSIAEAAGTSARRPLWVMSVDFAISTSRPLTLRQRTCCLAIDRSLLGAIQAPKTGASIHALRTQRLRMGRHQTDAPERTARHSPRGRPVGPQWHLLGVAVGLAEAELGVNLAVSLHPDASGSLDYLYRSTDRLSRRGAAVKNLSHSSSLRRS